MAEIILRVQPREKKGKGYNKRLRRQGLIPAVFYGHREQPCLLTVEEKKLRKILSTEMGIIDLDFGDGQLKKCILREIQYHPIKGYPLHVDFMGVKLTEKITTKVPIHLVGTPVGVKSSGGILEQHLKELEIECLPSDIPDHIEVDVSDLNIGDSLTVEDISLEKIDIVTPRDHSIASVVPPAVAKEVVEEVPKQEAPEPEVTEEEGKD